MKKRRFLIVSLVVCMIVAIVGGITACNLGHTHEWGDWELDIEPTLTEQGHAIRTCTICDEGVDETVVAELSDTTVWTYDTEHSTPATHTQKGEGVYVSDEFGTVKIELDKVGHTWTDWELDVEPTLTDKGHATRTCTEEDGGVDETDVPELTDKTVWTLDETRSTPSTHIQKGVGVYVSDDFGTVTIALDIVGDHEMTDWAWVDEEPTEDEGATAERHCTIPDCTESEEVDVPELTDTDVWSVSETVADYNHAGGKVYTSEYGTVLVKTADKLVAPYDNTTYTAIEMEGSSSNSVKNGNISAYWRSSVSLAVDETGSANGNAYPFSSGYRYVFSMVDAATGEILVHETDKNGNVKEYKGYVDFETKLIVMAGSATNMVKHFILTSYGVGKIADISASSWGTSLLDYAIAETYSYTDNGEPKVASIFIVNDVVHFGVTFTRLNGEAFEDADDIYGAEQVLVKKGGETLFAYGYDGTTMRKLDGLQGEWTGTVTGQGGGEATVKLSGYGTFTGTLGGSTPIEGTYVLREDGKLDLYVSVGGETLYFEVELELDGHKFTAKPVDVTITFNMNGHGTDIDAVTTSKNLPYALPEEPTAEGWLFRGWYLDAACDESVELTEDGRFVPTGNITLYAKWAKELTITVYVNGEEDDAPKTIKVGAGDRILESLEGLVKEIFDEETFYLFTGWYILDTDGSGHINISDPTFTYEENNDGEAIYGDWKYTPYIGTFTGAEIWYKSGGGTSAYTVKIETDGTVTAGNTKGTFVSYDADTQLITFQLSNGTYNYIIFDEVTGSLIMKYNNFTATTFSDDIYFCVRGGWTEMKHFAFKGPLPDGTGSTNNNARLITYKTTGDKEVSVFAYYNRIYNDFTIENTFGDPLDINSLPNASAAIVRDGSGKIIIARGTTSGTFNDDKDTLELDEYYGTYKPSTDEGDNLVLDGAGSLRWGELSGTYVAVTGADYMFDVYITNAEGTREYYELTLDTDAKTYTLVKRMVTVTLDVDSKDDTVSGQSGEYNKNIQITLPTPENDDYFFRGWFADADFTSELETDGENYIYTPRGNVTLYAKWVRKVVITVVYNNSDVENGSITDYGFGETLTVPRPSKTGSKFIGWFTDEECNTPWGTMDPATGITTATLASDSNAPTAITIYAKWGDPEQYSGTFTGYMFDGDNTNGGVDNGDVQSSPLVIDPEGKAAITSGFAWPFSSWTTTFAWASNEDASDAVRALTFSYSTSTATSVYSALLHRASGIMLLNTTGSGSGNTPYSEFIMLLPESITGITLAGSYWGKEGGTRVIHLEYNDSETLNIFIHDGRVYFGVEFKDIAGEEVAAESAYQATTFYVYQNGERIAGFGFNGTTMTAFDGYEGTYTYAGEDGNGIGTISVNGTGLIAVDGKQGNYTLVSGEEYTATLYFDGAYYHITFINNGGDLTYTLVKPMTTIIYHIDGHETTNNFPASEQHNMNIQFTLSIPEIEGYVFRGWYTDANHYYALKKDSEGNYIYTATTLETVTLYARILEEVTLTIVYGEGQGGTVEYKLAKGENMMEAGIKAPTVVNQKRFVRFYRLEEGEDGPVEKTFETNYVVGSSMTLYVEWLDIPEIEYVLDINTSQPWTYDEESGVYTSGGYHIGSALSTFEIRFGVDGTIKFHWFCQSEGTNWDYLTITHIKAEGSTETLITNKGGKDGQEGDLEIQVKAGDILRFVYRKDGSGDYEPDCAKISQVEWTKKED